VLYRLIMSASASTAGYLYASGRLRGRGARKEIRSAVPPAPAKKAPKIEYRRRKRWIVD